MIKDIIVNLGLGSRDPAGDFAISMADTFGSHVLGIAFAYEPIIPVTGMGGVSLEFIDSERMEADKKARTAVARFEKAAKQAGISAESRLVKASVAEALDRFGSMARCFDLAVVGQPEPDRSTPQELIDEGVLLESGHPVMVVPYIQKQGLRLDRVMVCWDGSRAASRAIADAIPLLKRAKNVDVLIVARRPGEEREFPGVDLGQHLARHDLNVSVNSIISPDVDVASTVLSYAADLSADMIVMGGYGHTRLSEFVFGGVTRGMFAAMTVPTLMSH